MKFLSSFLAVSLLVPSVMLASDFSDALQQLSSADHRSQAVASGLISGLSSKDQEAIRKTQEEFIKRNFQLQSALDKLIEAWVVDPSDISKERVSLVMYVSQLVYRKIDTSGAPVEAVCVVEDFKPFVLALTDRNKKDDEFVAGVVAVAKDLQKYNQAFANTLGNSSVMKSLAAEHKLTADEVARVVNAYVSTAINTMVVDELAYELQCMQRFLLACRNMACSISSKS